ncbi:ABC transporter substrate-binding protein [Acrocarpospora catenulata]|uniref:ABC transporter substrate-binding protein n=1 Tax=Acrocarpospora catenulata TaxID=2836182 RepID=UPI001BD97931|nr:ABC transporter substrate-binding protein [Acrocarpospora catenulata]
MKLTRLRARLRPSSLRKSAPAAALAAVATLAACGAPQSAVRSGDDSGSSYKVGVVTSYTGALAEVGKHWENGFLAGLDFLTGGTMKIDGKPIEILKGDDTGEAAVGTTVATNHLSKGAKIITGPATSAVGIAVVDVAKQNDALFIAGGMGSTDLVGMDKRVFLTNGNSPAGTMIYKKIIGDSPSGKKLVTINQDYAFGQTQAKSMEAMLTPEGVDVESIMLPLDTVDFSPTAHKIKAMKPDFVQTNWIGAGQEQLYTALAAQRTLTDATFFTTLFESTSWSGIAKALGDDLANSRFAIMYYPGLTGNEKDKYLQEYTAKQNRVVEFSDAIGWSSAEMVCRALTGGDYNDTAAMAQALRGWSFEGPQGKVDIRADDNQVIVPYFIVQLTQQGSGWGLKLDEAVPAADLVPPVVNAIK